MKTVEKSRVTWRKEGENDRVIIVDEKSDTRGNKLYDVRVKELREDGRLHTVSSSLNCSDWFGAARNAMQKSEALNRAGFYIVTA